MENFIDPLKLSGFIALAITLALWAWLKWHSVQNPRPIKYGCILKSDCIRLKSCKKNGQKRCVMRRWHKGPTRAAIAWALVIPITFFFGIVELIRHSMEPIKAMIAPIRYWWRFPPSREEMALPLKDDVDL